MDSLSEVAISSLTQPPASVLQSYDPNSESDALILDATLNSTDTQAAEVSTSLDDLYSGLSISAQKVIDKLNELLKAKLPNGVQSLKPEEVTSEATAERIVSGATSFYDVFAKQNPDLGSEELLNKFMDTIRGGIQQGYDDAYSTLEDIGAFDIDGVKQGVEETKILIEQKLQKFEDYMREKLGLPANGDVVAQTEYSAKNEILTQAGGKILDITA